MTLRSDDEVCRQRRGTQSLLIFDLRGIGPICLFIFLKNACKFSVYETRRLLLFRRPFG